MKVTYDLPPEIVSAVEGHAGALGKTVDEYVAERLVDAVDPPTTRIRVGSMVREGRSDAYIAAVLSYAPGRIAEIRRSLGLPANKRYPK